MCTHDHHTRTPPTRTGWRCPYASACGLVVADTRTCASVVCVACGLGVGGGGVAVCLHVVLQRPRASFMFNTHTRTANPHAGPHGRRLFARGGAYTPNPHARRRLKPHARALWRMRVGGARMRPRVGWWWPLHEHARVLCVWLVGWWWVVAGWQFVFMWCCSGRVPRSCSAHTRVPPTRTRAHTVVAYLRVAARACWPSPRASPYGLVTPVVRAYEYSRAHTTT
jgi:hypothetical protein